MAALKIQHGFVRALRAGKTDLRQRTPELHSLGDKTVALFGLGCVGAPSALELARAGIGELRVMDIDYVDPATTGRWPLGLSAAGLNKVDAIREFVRREYPYTKVKPYLRKLGSPRLGHPQERSEQDVLNEMTSGASLIYDATAELGVQHFLSEYAWQAGIPYVCVNGTQGGWGGLVGRFDPQWGSGCWNCFQYALADGAIPSPPQDPNGEVQPRGCGDPTFTGAGFDLVQVALTGVRTAVATLCVGTEGGYPSVTWDVMVIAFRDAGGTLIPPQFTGYSVERGPACPRCGGQV